MTDIPITPLKDMAHEPAMTLRAMAFLYGLTPEELFNEIRFGELSIKRHVDDEAAAALIGDLAEDPQGWWENGWVLESAFNRWLLSDSEVARRVCARQMFSAVNGSGPQAFAAPRPGFKTRFVGRPPGQGAVGYGPGGGAAGGAT